MLVCTVCGEEYQPKRVRKDAKYCSLACKDREGSRRQNQKLRESRVLCSLDGCQKVARWRGGMCSMHYRRERLTGDPGPVSAVIGSDAPCAVEGCDRPSYSKGLCSLHYNRRRISGDVGPAEVKKQATGEPWTDPRSGYVYVHSPGRRKRVLQHRVVMEQHIGRLLLPFENVHHRNGDRSDNRIENLELWSKSQPAGQRVADKIAWAQEILALYADIPSEVL